MTLHIAFNQTEIASRYYKITHPERKYSRDHSLRQFRQDTNINIAVLKKVLSGVLDEQKKILKNI